MYALSGLLDWKEDLGIHNKIYSYKLMLCSRATVFGGLQDAYDKPCFFYS